MALLLVLVLAVMVTVAIGWVTLRSLSQGNVDIIALWSFPVFFLAVTFGVGSVLSLTDPSWLAHRYGTIDNWSTVTVLLTTLGGGIAAYTLTFFASRKVRAPLILPRHIDLEKRLSTALIVVLILDWSGKAVLIKSGVYFTWLAAFSPDQYLSAGSNPLTVLQNNTQFFVLALAVYLRTYVRNRQIYSFIIAVEALLILASGSRGAFLYSIIIVAGIVYWPRLSGYRSSRVKAVLGALGIILLFLFASPILSQARYQMQRETKTLISNPWRIPVSFIGKYLPSALVTSLSSFSNGTKNNWPPGKELGNRFASQTEYLAIISTRQRQGYPSLSTDRSLQTLLQIVPGGLYPDKPILEYDRYTLSKFSIGKLNRTLEDAMSTPVSSAWAHGNWGGTIFFFGFAGLLAGAVATVLKRIQPITLMLVSGIFPAFLFQGSSFATYLNSVRNALLILLLIFVIIGVRWRADRKKVENAYR